MLTPESIPTHVPWATLRQSRLYSPVKDLGFGLRSGFTGLLGTSLYLLKRSAPAIFGLIYVRVMNTEKRKTNESRSAVFAYLLPLAIQFLITYNGIGAAFYRLPNFIPFLKNLS
jgi:hypothetical protein